ncbi:MAG: hypothetical protein ACYTHM_23225, partial [Planctomycetota bacterium]
MKTHLSAGSLRKACLAACALACVLGCRSYTGKVKTKFVKKERVNENVVVDELSLKAVTLPQRGKPYLEMAVKWDFQQE